VRLCTHVIASLRRNLWIWPSACIREVSSSKRQSQSKLRAPCLPSGDSLLGRAVARCCPSGSSSALCYCLQRRPRLRPYRCVDCYYSTESLRPTAGCLAGRHSQRSGLTAHITSRIGGKDVSPVEISKSRASEVANQSQPAAGEGGERELELASDAVSILEFVPTLAAWFLALRRSTIRLALQLPLTLASSVVSHIVPPKKNQSSPVLVSATPTTASDDSRGWLTDRVTAPPPRAAAAASTKSRHPGV
jgi:hypothetical protein